MRADEVGATYIIAQDPDADRFAAAERLYVYLLIIIYFIAFVL